MLRINTIYIRLCHYDILCDDGTYKEINNQHKKREKIKIP